MRTKGIAIVAILWLATVGVIVWWFTTHKPTPLLIDCLEFNDDFKCLRWAHPPQVDTTGLLTWALGATGVALVVIAIIAVLGHKPKPTNIG